jgi:integrase
MHSGRRALLKPQLNRAVPLLGPRLRRSNRQSLSPIGERHTKKAAKQVAAAKAMTFEQCAKGYISAHKAGWSNAKHAAQWETTVATYAYPHFGTLPVAAVDVGLVMKAIEPIWNDKPQTANRVRGRIESVLDWAKSRGHREGENPARWKGHLENLLPRVAKVQRVKHFEALPYREMGAFMLALRERSGVAARALEFTVLTAARVGEVLGARWREVDLVQRVWTIPAGRMKAGREHRVPLSEAAIAAMGPAGPPDALIFTGRRGLLYSASILRVLGQMEYSVTAHGFRSTFSDWCTERTGYPAEVREMALAHAVGNKVEAAYRRGDLFEKRRRLAEDWTAYCGRVEAAGEVVALRAG